MYADVTEMMVNIGQCSNSSAQNPMYTAEDMPDHFYTGKLGQPKHQQTIDKRESMGILIQKC